MANLDNLGLVETPYDASEFITDDDSQVELLNVALGSGNAAFIAHSLGVIAKARGMSEIARVAGVSRQSLYTGLDEDGNPTLSTVMAVMKALHLRLGLRADTEENQDA